MSASKIQKHAIMLNNSVNMLTIFFAFKRQLPIDENKGRIVQNKLHCN